jgi:hypothetical protein
MSSKNNSNKNIENKKKNLFLTSSPSLELYSNNQKKRFFVCSSINIKICGERKKRSFEVSFKNKCDKKSRN